MYVCVCQAVTERQIREAAQGGARTLKDLRRDLGVSSDCGRCASCAIQSAKAERPRSAGPADRLTAGSLAYRLNYVNPWRAIHDLANH